MCAYTGSQAGNQTQRKQTQSLMITLVKPSAPNSKPLEGDVSLAVFFLFKQMCIGSRSALQVHGLYSAP